MIVNVVPGGYNHAHADLMRVLVNVVLCLILLMLPFCKRSHFRGVVGPVLHVIVGIEDVVEGVVEATSVLLILLLEAIDGKVTGNDTLYLCLPLQELVV